MFSFVTFFTPCAHIKFNDLQKSMPQKINLISVQFHAVQDQNRFLFLKHRLGVFQYFTSLAMCKQAQH